MVVYQVTHQLSVPAQLKHCLRSSSSFLQCCFEGRWVIKCVKRGGSFNTSNFTHLLSWACLMLENTLITLIDFLKMTLRPYEQRHLKTNEAKCSFVHIFGHSSKTALNFTAPTSWSHQAFKDTDILPSVDLLEKLQFVLCRPWPWSPVTLPQVGHCHSHVGFLCLFLCLYVALIWKRQDGEKSKKVWLWKEVFTGS